MVRVSANANNPHKGGLRVIDGRMRLCQRSSVTASRNMFPFYHKCSLFVLFTIMG